MSDKKVRRFATRTLKEVPLSFENEDGNRVSENFTVIYRSYSRKTVEDFKKSVPESDREGGVPYSVMLGQYVVEIIDSDGEALTDDQGNKADLSNGFFDTIPLDEAEDLWKRIEADINPPKASLPPGESGSTQVANEA